MRSLSLRRRHVVAKISLDMRPPRRDVLRLAVDAGVDPSAVTRCLQGRPVRAATRTLVVQAAGRLGLGHLVPSCGESTDR